MYIDPSTGGLLFQILAVAFTAISGIVLLFSNKIKMYFSRLRRSDETEEAQADEQVE